MGRRAFISGLSAGALIAPWAFCPHCLSREGPRQKEIENLGADGLNTPVFHLASMINLVPDEGIWRQIVDLLAQLNADGLLKGREPIRPPATEVIIPMDQRPIMHKLLT
ncbi:hypothetical protein SAMN06265373_1122 [Shimia sagamensis]|uniref:Uncharacterized protein n=1 Tax=Shimia sagamensis TaxID=1566352 RepID=A0ABY1PJX5_9RHOB|nr:hypothetical protein SAMN06265373_1122 [Shimia sagamensis]